MVSAVKPSAKEVRQTPKKRGILEVTQDLEQCKRTLQELEQEYETAYSEFSARCKYVKHNNFYLKYQCDHGAETYQNLKRLREEAKTGLLSCSRAQDAIEEALEQLGRG